MYDLNSADTFHICSRPVDMRKGRDGLPQTVREIMGQDPTNSTRAFIFYSKDYRTLKILHYVRDGIEIYVRYYRSGGMLRPVFSEIRRSHTITRLQLQLLLTGAVVTTLEID